MILILLPDRLAVCSLPKDAPIPPWALAGGFLAIVRTGEELSIVCPEGRLPADIKSEPGWRALKVQGPLAFDQVGIVSALTTPLAEAGIPVFVISTYDTDYLLVKTPHLAEAIRTLSSDHTVRS